jgi:hypothetical protein
LELSENCSILEVQVKKFQNSNKAPPRKSKDLKPNPIIEKMNILMVDSQDLQHGARSMEHGIMHYHNFSQIDMERNFNRLVTKNASL